MSIAAMNWAWAVTGISPVVQLVLLCLADHHNEATGRCDPSIARISARTKLSGRSVERAIAALKAVGLVGSEARPGKRPMYALHLDITAETPVSVTGVNETNPRHCVGGTIY